MKSSTNRANGGASLAVAACEYVPEGGREREREKGIFHC